MPPTAKMPSEPKEEFDKDDKKSGKNERQLKDKKDKKKSNHGKTDKMKKKEKEHLQTVCDTHAYHCWTNGVLPAEAFKYPVQPEWFAAVLRAVATLEAARHDR